MFQRVPLDRRQFASAAFIAELGQPCQAFLLIKLVPITDRVVVHKKSFGNPLATPALVQKQQRVRPPRHAAFRFSVAHQCGKVFSCRIVKKIGANHASNKNPRQNLRQALFFVSPRTQGTAFSAVE